jgi:hypothetical protein
VVIGGMLALELPQFLSPAPTTTIWQTITAGVTDGRVPKQTALEAFAYLYKVDIPGVSVPKGVDGGDEPTSGTGAMRWVRANWEQLTPDQQAVINRYLTPGSNGQAIPIHASPSAGTSGGAAKPQFQLTSARNAGSIEVPSARDAGSIKVQLASDAPAGLAAAMTAELEADIARIGPKLGMPVLSSGSWAYPNIELILSDTDGGNEFFTTLAINDWKGNYEPCQVTAWKNGWQNERVTGSGGVSPTLHVLMTHEVVHCYQNVVFGNFETAAAVPAWIVEGTAIYLAADDTRIAEPMLPYVWARYFMPEIHLTGRTYDAFGYYSFLAQHGRNLWSLMLPAWRAAATGAASSNAFIAVLQGDNPDIRDNWAESYVRESAWGDPWIVDGFGLSPGTHATRHPAQALQDPGWTGSLDSRSNTVLNVDSTFGEVVTVATDGLASVHDNGGDSAVAFQTQRFCTASDGCVCPSGTLLAGQDMAPDKLTIPFVAAFNAPTGGSSYSIVSGKLADLCQQQPTPEPSGGGGKGGGGGGGGGGSNGPCGASCTNSNGDPHQLTVNKYHYDFQAAGEFTLLRSAGGSLEIQGRQEPYGTSGSVSINTAIAAKVGSHRVGVYMTATGLGARVDGTAVDLSAGSKDLGGGARIAAVDQGFEIDFPDGTQLWTLSVGRYGINAQIKPSAGLKASGVGLLGTVVPGGLGVPALPDGTRLPAATDRHARYTALYGQFADAWRVTDSTTLFDYDSGNSTATYTIKVYPAEAKDVTLTDLSADQQTAGAAACSAITDSALHDSCVYDVAVSGETGFATSYQATQTFYDSGGATATAPPASSAPATAPPGVVSGALTVTHGTALGGYAIGPGDIVYLSVQTGNNTYSLISFDPIAGKIVHQVDVPTETSVHYAAGSIWLPGLKTDANGNNCSVTRFDAGMLAEQATIPIPCAFILEPAMASDGDAIWFMDVSKYDSTTDKGAVITRLDPTTNTPGASVPVPFVNGYLADSQGALFYFDPQKGYYRLTTGSTSLDSLGTLASVVRPAGTGLWVESHDQTSAQYFTQAGSPDHTVQIGGILVGGDGQAAHAEVLGNNDGVSEEQLWRYPIDGSTPTKIAVAPTIDGNSLYYSSDPLPVSNGDGFLKMWTAHGGTQQPSLILLQWTPVP